MTKHKKTFSDGAIVKKAITVIANTLFKEHKNGNEILSDIQLGDNTISRKGMAMSANIMEQLEKDLGSCKWFSIQCDESVDSSSAAHGFPQNGF